jgi:hypothetical protein
LGRLKERGGRAGEVRSVLEKPLVRALKNFLLAASPAWGNFAIDETNKFVKITNLSN